MKRIAFLGLLCFCLAARAETFTSFDNLLTEQFLAFGFETPTAFTYDVKQEGDIKTYAGAVVFDENNADSHYLFGVSVALAPKWLDEASYSAEKRRAFQESAERGAHEFPSLGCRAQRKFYGAGPGGSGYGLVFTTSDCRYDVRVFVAMSLSAATADPAFDMDKIAFALSALYDKN